jgi:hypothetical protein
MQVSRRTFLAGLGAQTILSFVPARAFEQGAFAAYKATWLALQKGENVDTQTLVALLAHPDQFRQRIGARGPEKTWGVFTSCTPHKDVLFDYINNQLDLVLAPDSTSYPPVYDRGQYLGWTWSYHGRALLEMWQATGEQRFRHAFVAAARKVMAYRDDRFGQIDTIQRRAVRSWGANFPINGRPERVTDVTVTGLITLPILQFANLLKPSDPELSEFEGYVADIGPSMWEYERFYHFLPDDGAGYYVNMGDPNVVEPISHYAALGAALTEIYAFTGNAGYLERAAKLFAFMRKATFTDELGGASLPYMPTPDFPRDFIPEAFWKAAVTHELPLALWRHKIIVTRAEMEGYAKAIRTGVFLDPDTLGPLTRYYRTGQFFHLKTGWDDWDPYIHTLINFVGDSIMFHEFDPTIDTALAEYLIDYPRWFGTGMLEGAYGPYVKAYSYRNGLAI